MEILISIYVLKNLKYIMTCDQIPRELREMNPHPWLQNKPMIFIKTKNNVEKEEGRNDGSSFQLLI